MTERLDHSDTGRSLLLACCVVLWAGAFVATHIPASKLPEIRISDKKLHAVGFLVLTSVFYWTLVARGCVRWRRVLLVPSIMAIYAGVDEITQPLVRRSAAWGDWMADILGVILALLIWELFLALWKEHVRKGTEASSGP